MGEGEFEPGQHIGIVFQFRIGDVDATERTFVKMEPVAGIEEVERPLPRPVVLEIPRVLLPAFRRLDVVFDRIFVEQGRNGFRFVDLVPGTAHADRVPPAQTVFE